MMEGWNRLRWRLEGWGFGASSFHYGDLRWKDGVDKDGGWGGGGVGQAVSTMETFLKVSVAGVDR